ncbi:flagellar FlbD family protein [Blastococcus xanthinilyticus]|uniref:Flagellar protein FlbD n=1 Tax=Blastococcus xanthinilyticus TaxID=1564164 RepID=A0A5S5CQ96_9ACTN|nr:flagellar FlbD family protein [Blastococcus xanthinilyticus]TYP82777.1 flagellar protein FlbD [Blastococcus xanthinilyticus]
MIAVTCRNGKYFAVDPDHIERIEHHGDTEVHLVDGTHLVLDAGIDQVLRLIAEDRAGAFARRSSLLNGYAAMPPAARVARRIGVPTTGQA